MNSKSSVKLWSKMKFANLRVSVFRKIFWKISILFFSRQSAESCGVLKLRLFQVHFHQFLPPFLRKFDRRSSSIPKYVCVLVRICWRLPLSCLGAYQKMSFYETSFSRILAAVLASCSRWCICQTPFPKNDED